MRYCLTRYKKRQEEKAYRIYVTDTLRCIGKNTASFRGGPYVEKRFADVLNAKPQDDRTCKEITADIVSRCGLEVKHEPA